MHIRDTFHEIRDIPYRIPLSPSESDDCCSGKMKRLKRWLDENDYQSRYRVCSFRWSDTALPPEVSCVPHADDSTHVYLEVLLDEKWVNIDPTWDSALAAVLPVNFDWDGLSNTRVAVPIIDVYDSDRSAEIMAGTWDEADFRTNGAFYVAFNDWLEECRLRIA